MEILTKIRHALLKRNKMYVQGNRLVERLCKETALQRDEVIEGLKLLSESGEVSCKDWHRGEPIGRVQLSIVRQISKAEQRWCKVVTGQGLDANDLEALIGMSDALEGWEEADLLKLLHGLIVLRNDLPKLQGQSRYQISARYLLGSSKLLDALPSISLREFGVDPALLASSPSYIITAGPAEPDCVILVENPQAMEAALVAEGGKRIAWVATFGYGLSLSGDQFGQQLANIIEEGRGLIPLVRTGNPPPLEALLRHPKVYFWGDLDKEGLRIYWRLKFRIPQLQLSGLYHPMLSMILQEKAHHPYTRLVAKNNQSDWVCSDAAVQHLLNSCTERAVDQEALNEELIREFSPLRFSQTEYS